jgi:hypothetical protein
MSDVTMKAAGRCPAAFWQAARMKKRGSVEGEGENAIRVVDTHPKAEYADAAAVLADRKVEHALDVNMDVAARDRVNFVG